ncbi:D-alanyl-D-alanine carboxypeptidase family protein [Luteolibacter pohnpeiensis]|nr:serine hydrolase [Luteolibacter pohnpeiensis]
MLFPMVAMGQGTESIMVVEAHSGKILIATNSSVKRPVASLTKIATAVVAVDWTTASGLDIGSIEMTAPQTVAMVGGPNPMNLQPGDRISMRDAMYSALLGSDNLAALTIADYVGRQILIKRGKDGDPVAAFVGEMNKLAAAINMDRTHFENPHGLDNRKNIGTSTAADIARLSIYAMRRNAISFIVRQESRKISVTGPAGTREFNIKNTNELIGEPGILGLKTGTTNLAGPCLSVCMDRDAFITKKPDGSKGVTPRRLIVVLLNSPDRFTKARNLITQGWSIYDPWLESGAPVKNPEREILKVPDPR